MSALDKPKDNNSGVSKIQYMFENEEWKDYISKVMVTSEGVNKIHFKGIDNVGNISDEQIVEIQIDKSGPVMSIPPDLTYIASGDSVCLDTIGEPSATDELSGVRSITNNSSMTFSIGPTAVTWTATDNNGNQSTGLEYVTIENPPFPVDCQYGIIRLSESNYKVWFKANNFSPVSLRVKVKAGHEEEIISEMVLNNNVWEYKLYEVPLNNNIRYSFAYIRDGKKHMTEVRIYRTTLDNAIDSDYTKGVVNISEAEAVLWFKTNKFTSETVRLCYQMDGSNMGCIYMTQNNKWKLSIGDLHKNGIIKYHFLFTKGTGIAYKTPEYTYIHYRE